MKRIRVFESFAGYGSTAMAMKRLQQAFPADVSFEFVGISEIEPNALKAYEAVHGNVTNFGDISKIQWNDVPDFDLFTYSFPCQDISSAGKQGGFSEDSGTRSSLLWECRKAIQAKLPKYCLMENVKALVNEKFKADFRRWQFELESFGYTNYWQVLDAAQFGVPQHRERVFMVSILNCERPYYFPKPFPLTKRLKDVLEENVDEKYYLSDKRIQGLINSTKKESERGNGFKFEPVTGTDIAHTLQTTQDRKTDNFLLCPKVIQVGNYHKSGHNASAVLDPNGIAPTVMENHGTVSAVVEPKVINPLKGVTDKSWFFEQQVYDENGITRAIKSTDGSGNVPKVIQVGNLIQDVDGKFSNPQRGRVYDTSGIAPSLDVVGGGNREPKIISCASRKRGDNHEIEFRGDVANAVTTINTDSMVGVSVHPFSHAKEFDGNISEDVSPCLRATDYKAPHCVWYENFLVRKLTPRECFRLMNVSDEDIDKIKATGISKSAKYRLAGNSIVVSVLYHIFRKMFVDTEPESGQQLSLF